MKQLASISRNISAALDGGPDSLDADIQVELILDLVEPSYSLQDGQRIRKMEVQSVRFLSSPKGLRDFADRLYEYATQAEYLGDAFDATAKARGSEAPEAP